MSKASDRERAESADKLREWIKPGDTVYTILRHVSRSGMQREIGVVLLTSGDTASAPPVDLHPNYLVGKVVEARVGTRDGVVVGGCGMDMGFHLVYNLSARLYPDGFGCIGKGCPSNDHSNGDRDYTPHETHPPVCATDPACTAHVHWHKDGGYALRQRWL